MLQPEVPTLPHKHTLLHVATHTYTHPPIHPSPIPAQTHSHPYPVSCTYIYIYIHLNLTTCSHMSHACSFYGHWLAALRPSCGWHLDAIFSTAATIIKLRLNEFSVFQGLSRVNWEQVKLIVMSQFPYK